MARTRLVIVGAGGHGREMAAAVRDINERQPTWDFLGFVADGEEHPERAAAMGVPILGGVQELARLDAMYMVGVGAPATRARLDTFATEHGCESAVLVHPSAVVGTLVALEPGCYIAAGAVITTSTTIGRHSHVNVGASISHDCEIGRWCTIGPGARVGGWVRLDERVDLGIGAVVRDRVSVGAGAVVGAGAAVIDDVAPELTVVGVPARPIAH